MTDPTIDPVLILTTTERDDARIVLWCSEWDTPFGYWPTDDSDAAMAAAREWVRREPAIYGVPNDGDEIAEEARIEQWMSSLSVEYVSPASEPAFSVSDLCVALDGAGLHARANADSRGAQETGVYWVCPDGLVVVIREDGVRVDAAYDDGSTSGEAGWVAGDDPVDTVEEAMQALGVE
jgi:hypothetical protein